MEKKRKYRWTRIELLVIFTACTVRIGWEHHLTLEYQRQQETLRAAVEEGARTTEENDRGDEASLEAADSASGEETGDREEAALAEEETAEKTPVILGKYTELHKENADIADVNTPGDCFIIYGHNMKDGTMFGDLDEYRSEAYYREHSALQFDSLYEEREYEIMAVFLSHVYKEGEEGFRYYDFYTAETEEAFQEFYENVMGNALYDTGVTAAYGDTFLMLSTCAYHEEDGRLVVVAKRKAE